MPEVQSYGDQHPVVAIDLNNLAGLLKATNRLAEAEPLMARAVTIFEKSYGKAHPNVATTLNNLAQLLKATNRLREAEPLMRRALEIFHKFREGTGLEHPNVQAARRNYSELLTAIKLPEDEIKQRLRETTS